MTLRDLSTALMLGQAVSGAGLGEELRDVLDAQEDHEARNEELDRIQQILIDFGALLPDDTTTGLADLIEALLPPQGDG